MKRSTDRILSSHAGALPRPPDLRDMLNAKDAGGDYDTDAFAKQVRSAVVEIVQKQVETGIDIVNDGEESKPGFSNYARERLSGLELKDVLPGEVASAAVISGRDQAEFR